MKIRSILAAWFLLVGTSTSSSAQELVGHFGGAISVTSLPTLSRAEKEVFYRLVLRHYFLKYADRKDKLTEVRLVMGSVPAELLPSIRGVAFRYISNEEIRKLAQLDNVPEFEFYDVSEPEYRNGRWSVWIQWASVSRCSSHDSDLEFEFRRVRGRWKFRKGEYGVSVSEGGCWEPKPPPPAKVSPH